MVKAIKPKDIKFVLKRVPVFINKKTGQIIKITEQKPYDRKSGYNFDTDDMFFEEDFEYHA